MVQNQIIDDAFIERWHPKYEDTEHDEGEYQEMLPIVAQELKDCGTLTRETFRRITKWKSSRLLGIVRLDDYDVYERGLRQVYETADADRKLAILDALYGIGIPFASTILHFMYPTS